MDDTATSPDPISPKSQHPPQVTARADELLAQLSLAEKAGMMFHPMAMMGPGGTLAEPMAGLDLPGLRELIVGRHTPCQPGGPGDFGS